MHHLAELNIVDFFLKVLDVLTKHALIFIIKQQMRIFYRIQKKNFSSSNVFN